MSNRRLLHLFRVGSFDDVYNVKATQRGKAVFPRDTGTLPLNLIRYRLGHVLEVFRIFERLRRNATENHIRSHMALLYSLLLRAQHSWHIYSAHSFLELS